MNKDDIDELATDCALYLGEENLARAIYKNIRVNISPRNRDVFEGLALRCMRKILTNSGILVRDELVGRLLLIEDDRWPTFIMQYFRDWMKKEQPNEPTEEIRTLQQIKAHNKARASIEREG